MPRDLRFPKARRLTHTSEFDRVRREGRALRGEFLSLGVLVVHGNQPMRAGFVTSRKVGGAVARNRVRRRLREIARRHQHEVVGGVWIVTIASPRAARVTQKVLEDEWLRLARRAFILAP